MVIKMLVNPVPHINFYGNTKYLCVSLPFADEDLHQKKLLKPLPPCTSPLEDGVEMMNRYINQISYISQDLHQNDYVTF